MDRKKIVIIGSIILAVLLLLAIFVYGFMKKNRMLEKKRQQENARGEISALDAGDEYEYNYNLDNILFIGVDKEDAFSEHEEGWAGQADCLILLSMDKDRQETTLLEISRDSMTDVNVYSASGDRMGTERMQIAAQYAYGDGKKRSCQLTVQAVSNLLYEIPIRSYIAVNIEGIGRITELMGGVKITVPKDYTHIRPEFKQGAVLTLDGEQAESYVRYRDTDKTGSNSERMERQTQVLEALAKQLQGRDVAWYQKLWTGAEEDIVSNISVDEMERLAKYTVSEEILQVPGTVQKGEKHDEFIVDGQKLKEIMINLFYKTEN